MKELYRETKELLTKKKLPISENFTTNSLGLWWTLWIINNIIGQFVFRYSRNAESIDELTTLTIASIIANIVGIPLALITVKIVKDYSKVEPLLIESGFFIQRIENMVALWSMLTKERSSKQTPIAAWADNDKSELYLNASPIEVGGILEVMFWSQAAGVILCSATLTSLNNFEYFKRQSGLKANDGTQYLRLKSPFNYPDIPLIIAVMDNDPTQDGFDNELVEKIEHYLQDKQANLVLFSSYWQMNLVADKLAKRYALQFKKRHNNASQRILFAIPLPHLFCSLRRHF